MTLRGRLALVNVIVLLIALLLLAGIVLNQLVHDLYEQLDRELGLIGARELTRLDIVGGAPRFAPSDRQPPPEMSLTGFIRLLDPRFFHKLLEQRVYHLRGSIHIIHASQIVIFLARHGPPVIDRYTAHEIDLDNDFLPHLIPHFPLALRLVEVLENPVPGRRRRRFARKAAYRSLHHTINYPLVRMLALPPMPLPRPRPVRRIRIVNPDNAPRMNPLRRSYRRICDNLLGLRLLFSRNPLCKPYNSDTHKSKHRTE